MNAPIEDTPYGVKTLGVFLHRPGQSRIIVQDVRSSDDRHSSFLRIHLDQFYGMGEAQERRNTPWLNYFLEPRP